MSMKKIWLGVILLSAPCWAGLITHQDYTAGSVITSAAQNANENAVFNEFNGSIDNTNIKAGGITTTNIATASKLLLTNNVKVNYGAVGNGTTDDTGALQSALTACIGGTVYIPAGTYKTTAALQLHTDCNIVGDYSIDKSSSTEISQSNSSLNVFILPNQDGTGYTLANDKLYGLKLTGGLNSVYAENGATGLFIEHTVFNGPSGAGLFLRGFNQQIATKDVEWSGGQYGIFLSSAGLKSDHITTGTPVLFDKNTFSNSNFTGQTVNAVYVDVTTAGGVGTGETFYDTIVNNCVKDGIVINGVADVTFVNLNLEAVGYTNSAPLAPTTATTVAGSSQVIVGTISGLVVGTTVTIENAGAAGVDWYPYITKVFTSSIQVNAVAPSTVTSKELVTYLYSGVVIGNLHSSNQYTFINFNGTVRNSSIAAARYEIDFTGGFAGTCLNCITDGSPLTNGVYDPTRQMQMLSNKTTNYSIRPDLNGTPGAYKSSSQGSATNFPTSTQYGDLTSITITAGTWSLSSLVCETANGASFSTTGFRTAITSSSGNDATGTSYGQNFSESLPGTAASDNCMALSNVIVSPTASTTYYLKYYATYTGGPPKAVGTLTGIRLY